MERDNNLLYRIRENSIVFSASLILVLLLANIIFLIYNNYLQERATKTQVESQEIQMSLANMWGNVIRNVDLGLRGFALLKDENMLSPYEHAKGHYAEYRTLVWEQLNAQNYANITGFERVREEFDKYMQFCEYMVDLLRNDEMELFYEELRKDKGLDLWRIYEPYTEEVNRYQEDLSEKAALTYKKANTRMTVVQFLLGIIGVPTLIFMIIRIRRNEKLRNKLFQQLDNSNREYLFNSGKEIQVENEQELINSSIYHLKKASNFINQISAGNLEVDWDELDENNRKLNEKTLAGELIQMREKMKILKMEDARRMWMSVGEAKFSEIIRASQHDLKILCDSSLSYVVKYLQAQQGALFVVMDDEDQPYLKLTSCFAFDRKKFIDNRVEVGEGLVGQVFLEKETIMLTEVPDKYTNITSGLGDATPRCLILVPMKNNERVEAVIEIASFETFEPHQKEWLETVGEIMASTLISIKTAEKTQVLLKQFQEQTEQLRSQEEELRQNLEEMEATQEEIRRQSQELEQRKNKMGH